MCEQAEGLKDKADLNYFVVSLQCDSKGFVDRQEYLACNCDFEMLMRTNRRLTKTTVGWRIVQVFALPPGDFQRM